MNILDELNICLSRILPVETGVFSDTPPEEYLVFTPMTEQEFFADDKPFMESQEVRISLFSKGNYIVRRRQLLNALSRTDITVTSRQYIGHEKDNGYHHYNIDVAKAYETGGNKHGNNRIR